MAIKMLQGSPAMHTDTALLGRLYGAGSRVMLHARHSAVPMTAANSVAMGISVDHDSSCQDLPERWGRVLPAMPCPENLKHEAPASARGVHRPMVPTFMLD